MDSVTHIVLGACIGEAIGGRRIGKKAMLIGALAQSLPDIDIVASAWMPVHRDLLAHRGFTHSLLFADLAAMILAFACVRLFRKDGQPLVWWSMLWGVEILVHLFLDCFNVYGTGLFEPFSHYRVSFNAIFVFDPLLTIWPLVATIVLVLMGSHARGRGYIAHGATLLSALYLFYSCVNKTIVLHRTRELMARQGIVSDNILLTPAPASNMLWYCVAATDSGFYAGYRCVNDHTDTMRCHFIPQRKYLLQLAGDQREVNDLVRFSQGYYALEQRHDSLVFYDLRFGEILGWEDPSQPAYVFYYYLHRPGSNDMVVQRGRFTGWNREVFNNYLRRLRGL